MGAPVTTLPGVEEMGRRLAKIQFGADVDKEKFIVILSEYAERQLSGRGIVNMLQEVAVRYGPVGSQKSYEPLISKFQDVIKVLSSGQVRNDALDSLKTRSYM